MKFSGFLLLIVFAITQNAEAKKENNTYSILMPKYLRPGFPIGMVAEILKNANPVLIKAQLNSTDHSFVADLEESVEQGQSEILTFENKIPIDYQGSKMFNLSVKGIDSVTNDVLWESSTTNLEYNSKSFSIFLQSDKAIYQPMQTIKFRAVVTTPDLLPLVGSASFKLEDPDSNVILMESDAPLVNGVIGSEFKLGKHATLGDWKLSYTVHEFTEHLNLSVQEYKLPKFEIKIKPDKGYLHADSEAFTGTVSAKFTFGQPVKGGKARIELKLQPYPYYYFYDEPTPTSTPMITHTLNFADGEDSFSINVDDIKGLGWNPSYGSSRKLDVVAFVEDKNSKVELNATTTIDLEQRRIKIETVGKPEYVKPGLPYKAYIKVSEQDGTLLSARERENFGLTVTVQTIYPYDEVTYHSEVVTIEKELTIREDGIAVLDIFAETDEFESMSFSISVTSQPSYTHWDSWSSNRFKSPSNSYIQASTSKMNFFVGEEPELGVHLSHEPETYTIMLLARGKLVRKEAFSPTIYNGEHGRYYFLYQFTVTPEMSPSVYFIISYVRPDGEIVADSVKLNVQASLLNKVTIETNTNKTDTGQPVNITVSADPGSLIGLRGIDQSVLLLKEGNDITTTKIFTDLDKYGTTKEEYQNWGRIFWCGMESIGGANVPAVFENAGLIVLTNAEVFLSQPSWGNIYYEEGDIMFNMVVDLEFDDFDVQSDTSSTTTSQSSEPKVRKKFPETWIWTDSYAGENGKATFSYTTPDTITSWEISSFAISDQTGLGVTEQNSRITVFRNFFISLDLPPTMVRGEQLYLRVTVYNFFPNDLQVLVTLKESEWYELDIVGNHTKKYAAEREVTAPQQDGVTLIYPIRFVKVGLARISFKAISELAGDAVERTIVVKAEGLQFTKSYSNIVDRKDASAPPDEAIFPISLPTGIVPDSVRVSITISGNVLSNALNNLGNLLKMPYGCGEQNMLNFAPDVYISLYLKKVNRLTGEVATKSKAHIRQGYQKELTYQREDGSFSAFGAGDASGSTWLTAFVTKCFISAIQLNKDLVEESKVEDAANFLLQNIRESGQVNEPGRVIHTDMQGGVNPGETMTAFVLIGLTENNFFSEREDATAAINRAKTYLEERVENIESSYSLSVIAYALACTDSPLASGVLERLETKATLEGDVMFWKGGANTEQTHCIVEDSDCPYDQDKASSSDVETTAYVLLAMLKADYSIEFMPIIRWLIKQRNSNGGYSSTQDTVMAIQALATYAGKFADRDRDINIYLSHSADEDFDEAFEVTNENSLVVQTVELPSTEGNVVILSDGVGFADVQLNVLYNLLTTPRSDDPFVVDTTVEVLKQGNELHLTTCASINKDREGRAGETQSEGTGMFVITFALLSGFSIDDQEASANNKNAKMVELAGNEVTAYFDELVPDQPVCVDLNFVRYAEISRLRPRPISAYDYYKPNKIVSRMYEAGILGSEGNCYVCADCYDGCGVGSIQSQMLTIVTFIVVTFLLQT